MAYSLFTIALAIFLLPITFLLWNLTCLYRNYQIARRMDIPMVFVIASPDNPVWMLVSRPILAVVAFFFGGNCDVVRYGAPGWNNRVRHRMHEELGDIVVHVSPGRNWVYLCNGEAAYDVFKRGKDFERPPELMCRWLLMKMAILRDLSNVLL